MTLPYCDDPVCCSPTERQRMSKHADRLDAMTLAWCEYCPVCLRPLSRHSIHCPTLRDPKPLEDPRRCTASLELGREHEVRCNRAEPHDGVRATLVPMGGSNAHWHKPTEHQQFFVEWFNDTPAAGWVEVER